MAAPGFGAALLWGELGKQLGGWRDRNVQNRLQQKEEERIAAQDARVGMLDQRQQQWRTEDIARQTNQRAQDQAREDRLRTETIEQARWQDLQNLRDTTEAEERAFTRQKELAQLQAALTRQNREPREPTKPSLVQLGDGTWAWADHDNRTITPTGQTAPAKTGTGAGAGSNANLASSVDRLRVLSGMNTPQADLAFRSTFQKVMDPSGVIRDEDLKRQEAAGSFGDRIVGFVNRVQGRGALTDNQERGFIQAASAIAGQGVPAAGPTVDNLQSQLPQRIAQLKAQGITDPNEARRILQREGFRF